MKRSLFFKVVAVTVSASLAFTASAQGIQAVSSNLIPLVAARLQGPPPMYTGGPGVVNNGPFPGRDELSRNGIWDTTNRTLLGDLFQSATAERDEPVLPPSYVPADNTAPMNPDPSSGEEIGVRARGPFSRATGGLSRGQVSIIADPGAGSPMPWEASFPGGGSSSAPAVVNSNTGNRLTTIPIYSFSVRGGMELGLTLYHNSRRQHWDSYLGAKWSTNLDARLETNYAWGNGGTGREIVLTWGDGTPVPFEYDANKLKFVPPAGFYDSISEEMGSSPAWVLTTQAGTKYRFEPPAGSGPEKWQRGTLQTVTDRHGNAMTVAYEAGGTARKLTFTDPTGRTERRISFGYYSPGYIKSIADNYPGGGNRVWSFEYQAGNLWKITYPISATGQNPLSRVFSYDANSNITQETDLRGKNWGATYDTTNRCTGFTEPGVTMPGGAPYMGYQFAYNGANSTMTDPLGRVETHFYAGNTPGVGGQIASIRDTAGMTVRFTWDSARRMSGYVDEMGQTWNSVYDANGNIIQDITPLGYDNYTTFNADNLPATTTGDVGPSTIEYQYDVKKALSQVRRQTPPNAPQEILATIGNNTFGQPTSITVSPGSGGPARSATIDYDFYGQVIGTTTGTVTSAMTVSCMGWVSNLTNGAGETTNYIFDRWGRVKRINHPPVNGVSNFALIEYDDEDNITKITDERGKIYTWAYDDRGNAISTTNAANQTETYSYGPTGFLQSVTNGRGFTRTYAPTSRDEVYSLTLPDGSTEYWSYRPSGDVAKYQSGYGTTDTEWATYTYDADGRLTFVDYSKANTPDVTRTYSAPSATPINETMVDGSGTTTWTYNTWGHLTSLATPQGTSTYTSNRLGERTQMVDSVGTTSYAFDALGRLQTLVNPHSETTSYVYDNASRLSRRNLGNGTYEQVSYDARSRPTLISLRQPSGTVLRNHVYTYDAASNVQTYVNSSLGFPSQSTTYGYDSLNQLISEVRSGYSASYTYDANGNRATRTVNGLTETYTNDNADKLTGVTWAGGSKSFTYDAQGRRTSMTRTGPNAGTTNYVWDNESRLVSMGGQTTASYTYNGMDARVTASDGQTRTFRRDGVGVTSPVLSDGQATYTPGISERRAGTSRYLHSGIKNAESRTVSNTAIESVRTYDAFGNVLSTAGGSWTGAFGYAGAFGYQEDPSGLKLLGHRYYDSETGRFLSRDPIGDGRNWYTYCENNPVNAVDQSGLNGIKLIGYGVAMRIASLPVWAQRALATLLFGSWSNYQRALQSGQTLVSATSSVANVGAVRMVEVQRAAGESAMRFGQRAHAELSKPYLGDDRYIVDQPIGNGVLRRPDVRDEVILHLVEFKPNNARAIQEGLKQVAEYARLLKEKTGFDYTYEVIPYVPRAKRRSHSRLGGHRSFAPVR